MNQLLHFVAIVSRQLLKNILDAISQSDRHDMTILTLKAISAPMGKSPLFTEDVLLIFVNNYD